MTLSSSASRRQAPPRQAAPPVGLEQASNLPPLSAAGAIARVKAMLADTSDSRLAQFVAGKVFLVRVVSALIALGSQVLLARWMGRFEFGLYVYAWILVLMLGALSDIGLSLAARRFIPEYTELGAFDRLRGFLTGSLWLAAAVATLIGAVCAVVVALFTRWLDRYAIVPIYLGCAILPIYGLAQVQSGIAQAYNWALLALVPFFIGRQLILIGIIGAVWLVGIPTDAVMAMIAAAVAAWVVTLTQMIVLKGRLGRTVSAGPKQYEPRQWLATALPILVVEVFYLMLSYVDILALEHYRSPADVAVYYAAVRILAIVAFVYFAIAGAATHKFTEYHVAGDHARLARFFGETIRWTFWPSLAACVLILIFGRPLLALFGAGFAAGYGVMFILALGMLARAAVGPAERLLNMRGARGLCAAVYALAFAVNLGLCMLLIPRFGIEGAAIATSVALVAESSMLFLLVRRRLGHQFFVLRHAHH